MSATLRLTRQSGRTFMTMPELRRGQFDISVDGRKIGSLNNRDVVEAPIEPGHHTLRLRRGRYSSLDRSFDVADGDVVNFRCHGANLWPRWLVSFAVPVLAISLTRE